MVEEPPASRRPRYLTARYSKWLIPLLLILFICISSIIPSISKYTVTNNNVVQDNESNSQIAKEVSFENDGVEDGQTTTDTPLKPWLKDAAVRQSIRLNQTNYAIRGPSWLNNSTSGTPTNNELEKNISVAVHDANQTSIPTTEDKDALNMIHSIQHNGTTYENHTVMNQVSNNATTDLSPTLTQNHSSAVPTNILDNEVKEIVKNSSDLVSSHSLIPTNSSLTSHTNIVEQNAAANSTIPPQIMRYNNTLGETTTYYNHSTDVDLVSLTIRDDFFVLFNNSALISWIKHIQNVQSITFIGPSKDYALFQQNMNHHYPHLIGSNSSVALRWVNETHWVTSYKNKYGCPYNAACQQLIKLYVFDLKTQLNLDYIGNNILIVDSDTVWSKNTTFVHDNGKVQYFEAYGTYKRFPGDSNKPACTKMDPIQFTEAITIGTSSLGPRKATLTPYKSCQREGHMNATGARHIVHHMLFQYDVMMHLHNVITERWNVSSLWEAFNTCYKHEFCKSRIAEYELYYAFVSTQYPDRVKVETLINGENYMGSSAICSANEMECCERKGVLLKGCHDHRIKIYEKDPKNPLNKGDMCC